MLGEVAAWDSRVPKGSADESGALLADERFPKIEPDVTTRTRGKPRMDVSVAARPRAGSQAALD
jgi:hypothetical protein